MKSFLTVAQLKKQIKHLENLIAKFPTVRSLVRKWGFELVQLEGKLEAIEARKQPETPKQKQKQKQKQLTIWDIKPMEQIDSRIPKTLAEARQLAGLRFHVWNEETRTLCQEYMKGDCRADEVINNQNPATPKILDFCKKNDDVRLANAIASIAAKLK